MAAKHTPATPLPWKRVRWMNAFATGSNNETVCTASQDHGEDVIEVRDDDAAYLIHAANAYPRLVEALREAVASFDQLAKLNRCPENMKGARISRALLRELGEEA